MIAGIVVMLAVMGIRIFNKEPIEKGQRITQVRGMEREHNFHGTE